TTLHPNLGVVEVDHETFVIADIPGLIEGASEGAGLGTRFLGHIERCRALLHLVDGTLEDVAASYRTIRHELEAYGSGVAAKREVVALNKCDALTPEEIEEKRARLADAAGREVAVISGVAGTGIEALTYVLLGIVREGRTAEREEASEGRGGKQAYAP
ncbi:MAG: GTPase, partial [Rhodospirillales bacterium]